MNLNASQLDRYLTAERAFNEAIAKGATEQEAKDAARAAVSKKRDEQLLRKLGLDRVTSTSNPPRDEE